MFSVQLPDLKDAEAVQKFFLEEIQLGEELLAQGELEPTALRRYPSSSLSPIILGGGRGGCTV